MPSPILEQLFGDAVELTAAINQAPFVPGIIAGQKLFSEKGMDVICIIALIHAIRLG